MICFSVVAIVILSLCVYVKNTGAQTQPVIGTFPPNVPTIKFGRTTTFTPGSPQTPYGIILDQAFNLWQNYTNAKGGVVLNGTQYMVEQIVYNDGADCNTMLALYEYMITVDKVHVLFAPTGYFCQTLALLAEQYQIPYINGADAQYQAIAETDPAYRNVTFTFTLVADYHSTPNCLHALVASGIKTVAMFSVPQVPDYPTYTQQVVNATNGTVQLVLNTVFSLTDYAATLSADNTLAQNCTYFQDFINSLIDLQPDALVGTVSEYTDNLLVCMAYNNYYPPSRWDWVPINYPSSLDWLYNGSLGEDAWEANANYSDALFVTTQGFSELWLKTYGTPPNSYEAQQALSGELTVRVIEKYQSIDPYVIRAHFAEFNGSTFVNGRTFFNGHQTAQERICFQYYGAQRPPGVVWPLSDLNVVPLIAPWPFTVNATYVESFVSHNSRFTTTNLTLIIFFSCVGFIGLIVVAVLVYLFKFKWYMVNIPRADVEGKIDDDGM